ncbi:MAG: SH3 domain-containing protein [Oscillospiraceae bacterium]|jgi:cell wall-associated NlpC family hydrolase|nr:SH3 domain-containing protein [Oscillospiraceae bacterium]
MSIVIARDVADAALGLLKLPKIPYVLGASDPKRGMDCQGLVQYCVRKSGGVSRYIGSNDMFRNDTAYAWTLADARAQGKIVPGAAVYVVSPDGTRNQPKRYVGDGVGNAYHVGLFCGAADAECVSASSVKGYVGVTTLYQGWTHVTWLKDVDYSGVADFKLAGPTLPEGKETPYDAVVATPTGNKLNLRKLPSTTTGARIAQIPPGTVVKVLSGDQSGWVQVEYDGQDAWAMSQYLKTEA